MLSGEFAFLSQRGALPEHWELWWSGAPDGVVATDGFDRLLAASAVSSGLDEVLASGRPPFAGYYHETVTTPPGQAEWFLDSCETRWRPLAERAGAVYLGGYRTLARNDSEAVTLWGLPSWSDWVGTERVLRSAPGERWRREMAESGVDWDGKLLTGAPGSPLTTGAAL